MRSFAHRPARQRGLAVITAVLIVAIIATIAAYLGLGQQVWLRQTENLVERAQADSLRQAALDWVAMLLTRDASQNKTDHLGELWAKQLPPLPAEGGMIAVKIRDAQERFNLNNLLRSGNPGPADIAMFQRLLRAQGFDPALAEALIDWLDANSTTAGPGGAEDVEYLALSNPYRAANQLLTSVDELRLVRGFDAHVVETLRPLVTALPEATATNVNTAIEPVLDALLPAAPAGVWTDFLKTREAAPLTEPGQLSARLPPGTDTSQMPTWVINTRYFLVNIAIRVGRTERRSEALIFRPEGKPATVLWHRLTPVLPELKKTDENR
jgi:general secretion pathway protein K